MSRHRPIARQQGVQLEHAVPETPVRVTGDDTLIEQAVSNVIYNAVRYNARRPRGGGFRARALTSSRPLKVPRRMKLRPQATNSQLISERAPRPQVHPGMAWPERRYHTRMGSQPTSRLTSRRSLGLQLPHGGLKWIGPGCRGGKPLQPGHDPLDARRRGPDGSHGERLGEPKMWPLEPIPPGKPSRLFVETDAADGETRGTHTLRLWDDQGHEGASLDGMTFP